MARAFREPLELLGRSRAFERFDGARRQLAQHLVAPRTLEEHQRLRKRVDRIEFRRGTDVRRDDVPQLRGTGRRFEQRAERERQTAAHGAGEAAVADNLHIAVGRQHGRVERGRLRRARLPQRRRQRRHHRHRLVPLERDSRVAQVANGNHGRTDRPGDRRAGAGASGSTTRAARVGGGASLTPVRNAR